MLASVDKQILAPRMPMNINEQMDIPTLQRLSDHLLHRIDFWTLFDARILPLSIQVQTSE